MKAETTSKDIVEIKEAIGGTLTKGGGLRARIQRMETAFAVAIAFAVWISLSGITTFIDIKYQQETRRIVGEIVGEEVEKKIAPLRNDIAELRKALEPPNKPKDEKSQ